MVPDSHFIDMENEDNIFLDGDVPVEQAPIDSDEAERVAKINQFVLFLMTEKKTNKSMEEFKSYIGEISVYYQCGFRHSYYSISSTIYGRWYDSPEQLDTLSAWMDILKEDVPHMDQKTREGMNKFYDHIMLEVVRMKEHQKKIDSINELVRKFSEASKSDYNKQQISLSQTVADFENRYIETNEGIKSIEKRVESAQRNMNEMQNKVKKTQKKVKSVYSQFVSILGIFSAIVIVFFGGATVFSSVLTNIYRTKWYQVGFGVAFVGLVLFNVIFMFLYILSKMLEIDIGVKIELKNEHIITKWFLRYPYVFIFNLFCILIMFICGRY